MVSILFRILAVLAGAAFVDSAIEAQQGMEGKIAIACILIPLFLTSVYYWLWWLPKNWRKNDEATTLVENMQDIYGRKQKSIDMPQESTKCALSAGSVISDTERLDWLSNNLTINMGLAVGGYWHRSDIRWQQDRIREAIDSAMTKPPIKQVNQTQP